MKNSIAHNTEEVVKKKRIILIGTGFAIFLLAVLFLFAGGSGSKKKPNDLDKIIKNSKNKIILQDSSKGIKAEDRWLYEAQDKLSNVDQFMQESEKNNEKYNDRIENLEKRFADDFENQSQLIESQLSEIETLKSQIHDLQSNKNLAFQGGNTQNSFDPSFNQGEPLRTISTVTLDLTENNKSNQLAKGVYNVKDYIPAGSYAKAMIISGVDASVGISSQSDPRPILLRVKGPAVSSIYDGNAQKSDLTGCIVQGAASGDLSSEKVYVKLVTMTCGKGEDLVTELPVKGYVAGQGKSGVRGNVISREGDLVAKSFLAGLVSGFGQALSDKVAPPLAFSNGLTTQGALSTADVANRGLGKGTATAGDRLSNYLIERAEQYQPIVSIPSGIEVEIVFVEGFYFNPENKQKKQ